MVGNDLWLASTRLIYYQVQVTSQKLSRQWLNEDGDQFTNRPIKVDDYLVYTRLVRGNLGTRVSAINPTSGQPIWETDVGSPVTSLGTDGKGFVASTAQGAVFSLEAKSFSGTEMLEPIENLGRNQRSLTFSNPVVLKNSKIALLNQSSANQLLLIDPSRRDTNPSRIVALELGGGLPINEPIALGNGSVLIPLNNAQIAMIDPEKGKLIGTPFQPTVQAGERPNWLNPVLLSDNQTVVVADEQRNMIKLSTGKQLRTIVSRPLDKALKARLVVVEDVIVGVSATASGDQLDFFDSEELKLIKSVQVEGRFSWGPYAVQGDASSQLLAFSDIEGLVSCDSKGTQLWASQLGQIVPVGRPQAVGKDCLIATTSGEIIRLSIETGKPIARMQIGEPISGTPLLTASGLLVPCDEGVVMQVPMPEPNAETNTEAVGVN
jgi:outer membrane protein assembly factor BamB